MTKYYYREPSKHIVVTASITAQNQFTEAAEFDHKKPFNVSISGTFSATVVIQRSFDDGATWLTVTSFTANVETSGNSVEPGVLHRIGVATGGFTSGPIAVRLSQ